MIDLILRLVWYALTAAVACLFVYVFGSVVDGTAGINSDAGALVILGFILAIFVMGCVIGPTTK